MLYINKEEATEQLRKFAVHLNADFEEHVSSSSMILDNENGKGYVNSYNIHPGLSVRTYNIKFSKELKISKSQQNSNPLYFLYCVEGYYFHKFEGEEKTKKIEEKQNVILNSTPDINNIIVLPANVHLKMTAIMVNRQVVFNFNSENRQNLTIALADLVASIEDEKPFKYFGSINPITSEFAKLLVENERTDTVGKLLTEGAVINTLASQIDNYDKNQNLPKLSFPLSNSELLIVSKIGDYVLDNIESSIKISDLVKHFGLSDKKLQSGIRYLYGESLNAFIRNIRLERAKELIHSTDLSISEVCYSIGLTSKSYFSKTFSERYGMLPVHFKESLTRDSLIFELTYKSTVKPKLKTEELKQIVETSRKNNKLKKITGCLVHYEKNFFQILEGNKKDVLDLYSVIEKDDRHHEVVLLTKKVRTKKKFSTWNLALVSDDGNMNISIDGRPSQLNVESMIRKSKGAMTTDSEIFWKRIHNIIRVS